MSRNLGPVDRVVRVLAVAPLLVVLGVLAGAGTVVGLVFFALAGVMVASAAVGYCPLYAAIHVSTWGAGRASQS
jgi:hypothetical protein